MENIKYLVITFLILLLLGGWYIPKEINHSYKIEHILNPKERLKYIIKPTADYEYYYRKEYTIINRKSKIPFIYEKSDTIYLGKKYFKSIDNCNCHDDE